MNAQSFAMCLIWMLIAAPSAVAAPDDEAHRLDRLETRRLNEMAAKRFAPVVPPAPVALPPAPVALPPAPVALPAPPSTAAERALHAREQRAIDDWRRRVQACQAGERDAC